MLKGVKFPVRVTPLGGAETIEGSSVIDQNVLLAVIPSGTLHPWMQNLTPDEEIIFDIKDNRTGGLYSMTVRSYFEEMERKGYAKLLSGNRGIYIREAAPNEDGDMVVVINYINLESGRKEQSNIPLKK